MSDSPLTKPPFGILGALDLKTQGKQPTLFGERVTPVFEMRDHYVPLEILEKSQTITNPALAAADTFDVPNGELWIVRAWSAVGSVALADASTNVIAIASINNSLNQVVLHTQTATGGTTLLRVAPTNNLPLPVFLRPGWGFYIGLTMTAAPAVSFTYSISIAIQRLRD